MAHVVTEPCLNCKYGDCVEVCPVNCFYEGADQIFINPDECIDCEACVSECPVSAIVSDSEASSDWTAKNKNFDYTEDKRRTAKGDVSHGPQWKPT